MKKQWSVPLSGALSRDSYQASIMPLAMAHTQALSAPFIEIFYEN